MKNLIGILSLLFSLSLLSSCQKDAETLIDGTWNLIVLEHQECDSNNDNTSNNITISTTICDNSILCQQERYLFEEGQITLNRSSCFFNFCSEGIDNGNYTFDDQSLTLCLEKNAETLCETYNFKFKSKKLYLERPGREAGCIDRMVLEREE